MSHQQQPGPVYRSPFQLQQDLQIQIDRFQQEAEAHHVTRTLLLHTQNNARYWDRNAVTSQSHIYNLETRLLAAEAQCRELAKENDRLNLVLGHLVCDLPHFTESETQLIYEDT